MSDPLKIAIVGSVAPCLSALVAAAVVILSTRRHTKVVTEQLLQIHLLLNSALAALLEAAKGEAHAAGRREGIESARTEIRKEGL